MVNSLIIIAGTSSNTGKTTLLCDLLGEFEAKENWEAIKLTRGHYRSCGKDPHACCVSHLLSDQPLILSGRKQTYTAGKDTGRYWDSGASDVHWVIVTDDNLEQGIKTALARVKSGRVLIEGTSLLSFIEADFTVMTTRIVENTTKTKIKIKPSARRALDTGQIDAIYLFGENDEDAKIELLPPELALAAPIYTYTQRAQMIKRIRLAMMK